ncbi:MAG: YihY family inner membrane protein [Rikenellaceae bacterium]|nr:YihY family inner membrane protein [Rikenellaceae bacterium]
MIEKIKQIYRFLTEEIWNKEPHEYHSRFMRWFSGYIKVFIYTIQSYGQNQLVVRSAGLTYYTLLAIVPLAAVIFGVATLLGSKERMIDYLIQAMPRYEEIILEVTEFSGNMLQQAKGGLIAIFGFLILLWSVIKVFLNIEASFNYIWEVRKGRNITRKMSDYISVLIITPILWTIFSMASDQVETTLDNIVGGTILSPLLTFIGAFIPFVLAILIFTLVYVVMPNTKVHFMAALKAGIIAGTVFIFVQLFYAYGQSLLSRYNTIYGTFAALPLFLIWLNLCWQIVMFGAELSFGYQNIDRFEYERDAEKVSYNYRRKIMLLVMHRIAYNFMNDKEQMDSDQLANILNIPVRIVRDTLFELEKAGLIISVEDEKHKTVRYFPAHDVSGLTVYDVIRTVENHGLSHLSKKEYVEFRSVTRILQQLDQVVKASDNNILLKDIKVYDGKSSPDCDHR